MKRGAVPRLKGSLMTCGVEACNEELPLWLVVAGLWGVSSRARPGRVAYTSNSPPLEGLPFLWSCL